MLGFLLLPNTIVKMAEMLNNRGNARVKSEKVKSLIWVEDKKRLDFSWHLQSFIYIVLNGSSATRSVVGEHSEIILLAKKMKLQKNWFFKNGSGQIGITQNFRFEGCRLRFCCYQNTIIWCYHHIADRTWVTINKLMPCSSHYYDSYRVNLTMTYYN